MQLRGHQTQFYIDIVYGLGFATGFGYLLFVGMDPRIAAFQGGLVFGYILRVWENMSVYERILQEEVAAEAEEAVAAEAETEVAREIAEQVPDEVTAEVEKQVVKTMADEVKDRVEEEMDERFDEEMDERVTEEVEAQMGGRAAASSDNREGSRDSG